MGLVLPFIEYLTMKTNHNIIHKKLYAKHTTESELTTKQKNTRKLGNQLIQNLM